VLFGTPGAALLYAVAGALIALPPRAWPRLGRWLLPCTGLFLAGLAMLQAWPGRGFWGEPGGRPGPLAGMIRSMAQTPQPRPLASLVGGFGHLAAGHAFAVNLIAVVALALAAAALLTGRRAVVSGRCRAHRVLPGRLGADRGHGCVRRTGHRPEQHDPADPPGHRLRRFPAPAPSPARGGPGRPARPAVGRAGVVWLRRPRGGRFGGCGLWRRCGPWE
jgi:hypothetical protein